MQAVEVQAVEVLRAVWSANGQSTAELEDALGEQKAACKRMADVSFDGLGSQGGDLRAAWREKLEREGKLSSAGQHPRPRPRPGRAQAGWTVRRAVGELTETSCATAAIWPTAGWPPRCSSRCSLDRPILLEGEVGVGKTEVAKVLAAVFGRKLIRLQCYEGIDTNQALYEWDYARQMLQIRALSEQQARRRRRGRQAVRAEVPAGAAAAARRSGPATGPCC